MLKRIKQFLMGLFARLSENDYTFVADRLTKAEYEIFLTLARYDKKHAVMVARCLENEGAKLELVRAGLLHDIGKAGCPELTLVRRSIAVFLEWKAPEETLLLAKKGRGKLAVAVRAHKLHPEIGATILEEMGADDYIVSIVRLHQSGEAGEDIKADIEHLRSIDDRL